jgi:hypothetical protein
MRAPSTIAITPFVIGTLATLYWAWEHSDKAAIWIVPFFVMMAVIYIMSPQIDWWWYDRNPPKLEDRMMQLIERYSAVYQTFNEKEKAFFMSRTALISMTKNYMPMGGMDSVPSDIEVWIAAHLAVLTLKKEKNFEIEAYENVVVYPKLFPSPQHPLVFHASEIFEEDGVVMLGIEPMLRGITLPNQYYNVVLHEWIKVYLQQEKPSFVHDVDDVWESLSQISAYSREHIESCIGLPCDDARAVSIHHFFQFQSNFKIHLPQHFEEYRTMFYL